LSESIKQDVDLERTLIALGAWLLHNDVTIKDLELEVLVGIRDSIALEIQGRIGEIH
jgi:hypothetical protein